jgi:predicted RNA-binding Zn ribbon-like protein
MQRFEKATPEQLLMPVALSGAELLASGNFDLVRACESAECVLQFYDRTKSHRRRWCSMATCGNRHKVAAFRARDARQK